MLKILHVYKVYFPDCYAGVPEAIKQISLGTQKNGINSSIFTLSPNPNPEFLNLPEGQLFRAQLKASISSCSFGNYKSIQLFKKISQSVDLIHYHYPWPFADLLSFFSPTNTKAIVTWHSDILKQKILKIFYYPLMMIFLKKMQYIIATSPNYVFSSDVLNQICLKKKVKVIPLCIADISKDSKKYCFLSSRLKLKYNKYFLFIGAPRYYKGLFYLIHAANLTDQQIVIVGDGPEMNHIKNISNMLRTKNVVFVGNVPNGEKNYLLEKCMALILPSHLRTEAFGMVLLEASVHGRPMITCEIGTGTSFVNVNNVTGFVVPPSCAYSLARAIDMMANDPRRAELMGKEARRRYELLFKPKLIADAYTKVYKNTLEGVFK